MILKKKELSILIPCYNCVCVSLVRDLLEQLKAEAVDYEIIVAEDGSTDLSAIEENAKIEAWAGCRHLRRKKNVGRATIRNVLAREAQLSYLLYIDADMTMVNDQYIRRYLQSDCDTVIDGGVTIGGDEKALRGNLRYHYEKAEEASHTTPLRQLTPYQHLHTANLMIRRDLMLAYPFDERFRRYGYEDVLMGKTLHQHRIAILHIDNPLGFCSFEKNPDFVAKTEDGLRTLHEFRNELRGYSRLLTFVGNIHLGIVRGAIRLWHRLMGGIERRNLCGSHPNLTVFKLYRLGYFMTIDN